VLPFLTRKGGGRGKKKSPRRLGQLPFILSYCDPPKKRGEGIPIFYMGEGGKEGVSQRGLKILFKMACWKGKKGGRLSSSLLLMSKQKRGEPLT